MVTDLVRLSKVIERAEKEQLPANVIHKLRQLGHDIMSERKKSKEPRPPAPEGGISLSEASRRYNIPHQTISRWVKAGYINKLMYDGYALYIDENRMEQIANAYHIRPGRGTWAVRRFTQEENA